MIRSMINKLIAAARVTFLAGGLAAILTLTMLGTTTALAALPGDPFRLGQLNALDGATTILSGTQTNGAMLEIGNSSSDFDDPALSLRVQSGRPPLTVSSGAGKAPNLDADKLDGKDSSDFALGIDGKALNANTLDGLDSTAFASGTNGIANDADKLDGKDSSEFAPGSNGIANNADKLDGKDSGEFAPGSNGIANNADKLDGKDSSEFAPGSNGIANNANLLDNKDSTAFANGTNGIANNANLLDGKDSTAFWSGKTYNVVTNQNGFGGGIQTHLSAACDTGDIVLSIDGGSTAAEDWVSGTDISGSSSFGSLRVTDNGSGSLITATALCADFPPLRP